MKKTILVLLMPMIISGLFAGCGDSDAGFDAGREITVVSREDGSGTRGAFIELFGIQIKGEDGSRKDKTTKDSIIANKTDVTMINVANDRYAIGYISLGSLNDSVKALKIDGVSPSADTVKDGSYIVSRPFNIATKGEPEGLAKDFLDFVMSAEGQEVVETIYIPVDELASAYKGSKPSGKIVIAGSSSVTPIMEKLVEAYQKINTGANIEIQMSDSTAGMTGAIDGIFDIGMASRKLKDSEKEQLKDLTIALDGIVIVVNKGNPLENLTLEQVREIYTGKITSWEL